MLFTASNLFIGEIVSIEDFGPEVLLKLRIANRSGGTDLQTWAMRWSSKIGAFVGVYSGTTFHIAVH